MKVAKAAVRALHPSVARVLLSDWVRGARTSRPMASEAHLDATMLWLCRAQDRGGGHGVSAGYSLVHGWFLPYPETTGYIIPTMLDYAHLTGRDEFRQRALRMADWEVEIQMPSGAVLTDLYAPDGENDKPAVFNTSQVILGWCRAFDETGAETYLDAASRAGDWLVQAQSPDGSWWLEDPGTETRVHAYDVRTAWSLLELHRLTNRAEYREAAKRNIEWTLAQQHDNGWFDNNAFFVSEGKWTLPLTHTIAYVMEGLLESGRLLGDDGCFAAARKTADRLLRIFEIRRFMQGEFDAQWKSGPRYSCLTGNVQIAGVWLRLYERTRDARYLNAALKLNDYVKGTQRLSALHPGIRGGVKGSQPITGRYTRLTYVNWGAKFLADALMLELRLWHEFERETLAPVPASGSEPGSD